MLNNVPSTGFETVPGAHTAQPNPFALIADATQPESQALVARTLEALRLPPPVVAPSRTIDHSVSRGIITHSEHFADLILIQAGSETESHFAAFSAMTHGMLADIKRGSVAFVNEKIDGSPALVLGFRSDGVPFVTYKGLFDCKREQVLFTSAAEARAHYLEVPELSVLYGACAELLAPRLKGASELQDYIFQADLLFSPGDNRRRTDEFGLIVQPNEIAYPVAPSSPYFASINEARVGLAIHTVGRRQVDRETGRLNVEPETNHQLISQCAARLISPDIFAIDPFRRDLALEKRMPQSRHSKALALLAETELLVRTLSPEFRQQWREHHHKRFQTYFNSTVKSVGQSSLYHDAAHGERMSPRRYLSGFESWLGPRIEARREPKIYGERFNSFRHRHPLELNNLLKAYFNAVRLQYLVQRYYKPALNSKLGPTLSEGIMLSSEMHIAKFVDRLGFTVRNNMRRQRSDVIIAETQPERAPLPYPFNRWRPGAAFVIGKMQPPHRGHIDMIRDSIERHPGPLFIVVSDKVPDMKAVDWKSFGATGSKKELKQQELTYIYDNALRADILKSGLGRHTRIHFHSTGLLMSYLERAREGNERGAISLVVGSKEVQADRYRTLLDKYPDHLNLLVVDEKCSGLSGTDTRSLVRDYVLNGSMESWRRLCENYAFIASEAERGELLERLASRWKRVNMRGQKLLTYGR